MEVMTGPSFSMEVSAPTAYVRDLNGVAVQDKADEKGNAPDRLRDGLGLGLRLGLSCQTADYSSDSSSSIGAPGDSEDEDESIEDDSISSNPSLGLGSLSSLEDSLSFKRGLSNHYKGKSKSFANLLGVNAVKEMEKTENPLNKRRRVVITSKWSRRSSFYSWQNPKSMPVFPVIRDGDGDGDDDDEHEDEQVDHEDDPKSSLSSSSDDEDSNKRKFQEKDLSKAATFKSQRCFSLADLQEEHR